MFLWLFRLKNHFYLSKNLLNKLLFYFINLNRNNSKCNSHIFILLDIYYNIKLIFLIHISFMLIWKMDLFHQVLIFLRIFILFNNRFPNHYLLIFFLLFKLSRILKNRKFLINFKKENLFALKNFWKNRFYLNSLLNLQSQKNNHLLWIIKNRD